MIDSHVIVHNKIFVDDGAANEDSDTCLPTFVSDSETESIGGY